MTNPDLKVDPHETLYVTDAELIRRLGIGEKLGYSNLRTLDADRRSGFPRKQEFWGERRYWPAVKAWLDRHAGLMISAPQSRERTHASGR